ncbi:MAG: hypothetical protein ACK48K_14470, partial [Planctomycetota bacterium]
MKAASRWAQGVPTLCLIAHRGKERHAIPPACRSGSNEVKDTGLFVARGPRVIGDARMQAIDRLLVF